MKTTKTLLASGLVAMLTATALQVASRVEDAAFWHYAAATDRAGALPPLKPGALEALGSAAQAALTANAWEQGFQVAATCLAVVGVATLAAFAVLYFRRKAVRSLSQ